MNVGKLKRIAVSLWLVLLLAVAYVLVSSLVSGWFPGDEGDEWSQPVDLSSLQPGDMTEVRAGRGLYRILRPTKEMMRGLSQLRDHVWQADITSLNSQYSFFIYSAMSSYLPCKLQHQPRNTGRAGNNWQGGYRDPCHGGGYDYAGRAIRAWSYSPDGVVRETPNLPVPVYRVEEGGKLFIKVK